MSDVKRCIMFLPGAVAVHTLSHPIFSIAAAYGIRRREEVSEVFSAPLLDLVYRAAHVHRMYNDPSLVQVSLCIECAQHHAHLPLCSRKALTIHFEFGSVPVVCTYPIRACDTMCLNQRIYRERLGSATSHEGRAVASSANPAASLRFYAFALLHAHLFCSKYAARLLPAALFLHMGCNYYVGSHDDM